jgi:ubiquinone/menaquinone biosynthesis C-methylase UbiE
MRTVAHAARDLQTRLTMTTIAAIYDELVADSYDEDAFGILAYSQGMAVQQIRRWLRADLPHILDIGTGTGETLLALLAQYPNSPNMVGLDVSARMLEIAGAKLRRAGAARVSLVHDGAESVGQRFHGAFDLAMSHFILNYVGLETLARGVARAVRPGGLWSLVTTTSDAFPRLQALGLSLAIVSREELCAHCRVPAAQPEIDASVGRAGFITLQHHVVEQTICFDDFDALLHFALHSGWFASERIAQVNPAEILSLRQLSDGLFPLHDVVKVTVRLARRD